MPHMYQNRALRLTLVLVLLFVGGAFSLAGILGSKNNVAPSISLSSSENIESCKVPTESSKQCSADKGHSDNEANANHCQNHCQNHCGHCITGMLSAQSPLSPNIETRKVLVKAENPPRNSALEPGFRPPNL